MKQGRILVNTGNGKGKTTAALGLAMRAAGQGMKVLIIQFLKASINTGEMKIARKLKPEITILTMGKGFVSKDPKKLKLHRSYAAKALKSAEAALISKKYDVIILDEINNALSYGLLEEKELIDLLNMPGHGVHFVLTGRDAKKKIKDLADTVTEMKEVKHAYQKGIKARKGIEF